MNKYIIMVLFVGLAFLPIVEGRPTPFCAKVHVCNLDNGAYNDSADVYESYYYSTPGSGGGFGTGDLAGYLSGNETLFRYYDTFMDYLFMHFVTREEYEGLQLRMDFLQAQLNVGPGSTEAVAVETAKLTAMRTGKPQYWNQWVCQPSGWCMKVVGK